MKGTKFDILLPTGIANNPTRTYTVKGNPEALDELRDFVVKLEFSAEAHYSKKSASYYDTALGGKFFIYVMEWQRKKSPA